MNMVSLFIITQCLLVTILGQSQIYGEWIDATWKQYPFMAKISNYCGGSIISLSGNKGNGVILTAAHCIKDEKGVNPTSVKIYIGCTKTNCGQQSDGTAITEGKEYVATSFEVHEKYDATLPTSDPNWGNNDIALVLLNEPIKFTDAVAIPIHNSMDVIKNNDQVITLGYLGICQFGRTNSQTDEQCKGGSDLDTLEFERTNFMATKQCEAEQGIQVAGAHEFCVKDDVPDAAGKFTSSCGGDSGSPLVFKDKQIGLVSYGDAFCDPTKASMATSVPFYYEWIKSKCAACVAATTATTTTTTSAAPKGIEGISTTMIIIIVASSVGVIIIASIIIIIIWWRIKNKNQPETEQDGTIQNKDEKTGLVLSKKEMQRRVDLDRFQVNDADHAEMLEADRLKSIALPGSDIDDSDFL